MADEFVNIQVDGVAVKARKGDTIIRATDTAGIYVPRFCYHEKLSIPANCRMCLVDVEKAPKPRAAGDDGVPPHQSPPRLPDLRSGW
jgi:NADH-quinone oxidoreductase subunit G